MRNMNESIFIPLLGFNTGVELAQLLLVAPIVIIGNILFKKNENFNEKLWTYTGSGIGLILSLYLIFG